MMSKFKCLVFVALFASMGCVGEADEPTSDGAIAADASASGPLVGKADGFDSADRGCQVVLRQALRRSDGRGGFETEQGAWVWTVQVDIAQSALDAGGTAHVLYRSNIKPEPTWWRAEAKMTAGAPDGFQRFEARLSQEMAGPGMSGSALERFQVNLIPFLKTKTGARHFDHNHLAGDFDLYTLSSKDGWGVETDALVCGGFDVPEGAVLTFNAGWETQLEGELVAGEPFSIVYDSARKPECRNTHNGSPAWGLDAYVLFLPDEEVKEESVIAFGNHQGTPTNTVEVSPVTLTIPKGTTSVEIWFRNWSGAGSTCESWDSQFGENYVFTVKDNGGE